MPAQWKHGENNSNSRLHRIWHQMRNRCSNPKNKDYHRYGGRGITVYMQWEDYLEFKAWAEANGYSPDLQIDREDNDGDYTPENCRWVDRTLQRRNQHRYKGLGEWKDHPACKVSYETFRKRMYTGWALEDALTTPPVINGSRRVRDTVTV